MSAATPADPGNTPPNRGLSDAFGVAAASSLRHAAPRRARAVEETTSSADKPAEIEGRSSEPEAVEADITDPGPSGAAPPAAKAPRSEAGEPAPIALRPQHRASLGRFPPVQVRDRRFLHGLLLAATTGSPTGRDLIEFVRECSDGVFDLSAGVVYRELHRLEKERLIHVSREGGTRRDGTR